jgi:hypothetical protein
MTQCHLPQRRLGTSVQVVTNVAIGRSTGRAVHFADARR